MIQSIIDIQGPDERPDDVRAESMPSAPLAAFPSEATKTDALGDGANAMQKRRTHERFQHFRPAAMALTVLVGLVSCGQGGGPVTDASHGALSVPWSIVGVDFQPLSCGQIGAATVSVRVRNRTTGADQLSTFPCNASPATIPLLAPGFVQVHVELDTPDGALRAAEILVAVKPGQVTVLESTVLGVPRLALSFAAQGTSSNCQSPASRGAGITSDTLTLVRGDGGCAPVTFNRSRDGLVLDTHVASCSMPAVIDCIERNDVFSVRTIDPGTYVVHVRGRVGALDCWSADETLVVPTTGIATRTVKLVRVLRPGCPVLAESRRASP